MDCYILVSLLFVIGTLVEFACVVFVKQNSDLFKTSKAIHEEYFNKQASMVKECPNISNTTSNVECYGKNNNALTETEKLKIFEEKSGKPLILKFKALPVTTKIDFVTFLIFNFVFVTFNFVYFLCF